MTAVAFAVAVALTGIWLFLIGGSELQFIGKQLLKARSGHSRNNFSLKELTIIQPFMQLVERFSLHEWLQLPLSSFHMKLLVLEDAGWTLGSTKTRVAEACGIGYAAACGAAWIGALAAEPLMLLIGLVIGGVLVLRPFMNAARELEQRRKAIVTELPLMMSELMLLVGAGETVQGSLMRCLDGKEVSQHPLYKEWRSAVDAMRNGHSFQSALERFNRRCAVQEASVFTTVLLLNYRKGGEHFVLALRELSYSLWEKRKAAAKSRGEEASSKLVFPLVGILLVMMLLIAAPAVMLMG